MIRPLGDRDAEEYARLRRASLIEHPLAFGSSPDDDVAATAAAVRELLRQPSRGIILGAFEPQLVGAVGIVRDRHRKAAHKMHIWGMYVIPDQRRRGVGRLLLNAALDHARSHEGVSAVHLSVTSAAPEARRLYEDFGFRVWGTEPEALRHDGQGVVEYHLSLRLG